jgi:hypothetical protein
MWTIWDLDDDPAGNVQHIAENDLTKEDVQFVLDNPESHGVSRSSGRPCVFGYTPDGRYIIVAYDQIDPTTVYPVTAYEIED